MPKKKSPPTTRKGHGRAEEDGSMRVKGGKVFDPDTGKIRSVRKPKPRKK